MDVKEQLRTALVFGAFAAGWASTSSFSDRHDLQGWGFALVSGALFAYVCADHAHERGRSQWWGLLGFGGLVGVAIVGLVCRRRGPRGFVDGWPEDQSPYARAVPIDPPRFVPRHRAG